MFFFVVIFCFYSLIGGKRPSGVYAAGAGAHTEGAGGITRDTQHIRLVRVEKCLVAGFALSHSREGKRTGCAAAVRARATRSHVPSRCAVVVVRIMPTQACVLRLRLARFIVRVPPR